MKNPIVIIVAIVVLLTTYGCSKKATTFPYILQSDQTILEATDQQAAVEVAKIIEFKSTTPVLHDELDCTKGNSSIKVKSPGSLQTSFDRLVAADWDCVLIVD